MLVEFAMVSFAIYLLFVVLLDLGRASLASQTVQGAAKIAAQELARAPLPATMTFDEALRDPHVTASIYDETKLVVPIGGLDGGQVDDLFATFPIVNQALRPLMINDTISGGGGSPEPVLRYPGALVDGPNGRTVFIPQVVERDWSNGGIETIRFRPVVEEVRAPGSEGHFAIDSGTFLAGFVNLRVNYPFQAGTMTAYDPDPATFGPASAVVADDSAVSTATDGGLPTGYSLVQVAGPVSGSTYAGTYGLGMHYLGTDPGNGPRQVRPFRRLLSFQHPARREVIVPE